jgi:hypothetical protein
VDRCRTVESSEIVFQKITVYPAIYTPLLQLLLNLVKVDTFGNEQGYILELFGTLVRNRQKLPYVHWYAFIRLQTFVNSREGKISTQQQLFLFILLLQLEKLKSLSHLRYKLGPTYNIPLNALHNSRSNPDLIFLSVIIVVYLLSLRRHNHNFQDIVTLNIFSICPSIVLVQGLLFVALVVGMKNHGNKSYPNLFV